MLRNLCRTPFLSSLAKRNLKYSQHCKPPKPKYECPHEKVCEDAEEEVHPFLVETTCKGHDKFYTKIFYFVCVPAIIGAIINCIYIRPRPKRPPFVPYPYLRIRKKKFPWGDGNKTLFHNPRMNALPDGYEVEEEEED